MAARRSLLAVSFAAIVLASSLVTAAAEVAEIAANQKAEKKDFTDAQISDGFLKIAFGAEYHLAGHVDRIRKYHTPIRIFISGVERPDRSKQLAKVTADIGRHVPNIDIAMTSNRSDANVIVTFVNDRDLDGSIRKFYGAEQAQAIRKKLDPQCLSGFRKNGNYEIEHSEVILTVDSGDFIFLDCAYEELLQSLGPINDTPTIPWTMFNDDVSMGFFDIYDQYLLNILYDPRIKAGMNVNEVRSLLPAILPDIRSTVAKTNEPGDKRPEK